MSARDRIIDPIRFPRLPAGPDGTVYAFRSGARHDEIAPVQSQASAPRPGAAAVWVDGEFADPLDPDTYEYTTLAEMFARDVRDATARQYVSPDGSLFLPAWRLFRQGPDGSYPGMDETGWRWSHSLDTYGFITALPGSGSRSSARPRTGRPLRRSSLTGRSGACNRSRNAAVRALPWTPPPMSTSRTDRVSSSMRRGKPLGQIDVPERPTGLFFGGSERRTLFILTHHALYAVETRHPGGAFTRGS